MKIQYQIHEAKISHDTERGYVSVLLYASHNADESSREDMLPQFHFEVSAKWPTDSNPDESKVLRFIIGHMDDMLDVLQDSAMLNNRVEDFE